MSACGSTGEPYRFTGRRYDPETGLYYYRARYYDPAKGRFLQTDPVGYKADLNLYTYVGNAPTDAADPSGTCPRILHGCGGEGLDGLQGVDVSDSGINSTVDIMFTPDIGSLSGEPEPSPASPPQNPGSGNPTGTSTTQNSSNPNSAQVGDISVPETVVVTGSRKCTGCYQVAGGISRLPNPANDNGPSVCLIAGIKCANNAVRELAPSELNDARNGCMVESVALCTAKVIESAKAGSKNTVIPLVRYPDGTVVVIRRGGNAEILPVRQGDFNTIVPPTLPGN